MSADHVNRRSATSVPAGEVVVSSVDPDGAQLLADAVAHGAIGILVVDAEGTILAANPTIARWTGGTPEQLRGRPVWRCVGLISEAGWPHQWTRLLEVGWVEFDGVTRIVDGSERRSHTSLELQRSPGRPPRAVIRNTPRPTAMAARETGPFDWYRCAAEYGEEGFWDWNVATGRISVSRQWCDVFGLSPRNAVTLDMTRSILSPSGFTRLLADSSRMARGEVESCEAVVRARRLDGRSIWIRHRAYVASRTAEGRVARVVGLVLDITDERASANALRDLVERVPVAVLVYHADGRLKLWNRAVAGLLGCPPDGVEAEIERRRAEGWDLVDEQGHPVPPEGLPSRLALETGEPIRDRVYGLIPRGATTLRWGILSALPQVDANGHVLDVVTTFTDITAHRRLELALARTRRLEGLGRLAGGVAHDFNNLLTAIVGSAELIRMTAPDEDEVLEEVTEIVAAARRGSALTRQLLGYARKQPMQARPFLLGKMVRRAGALLDRVLGAGIRVVLPEHDGPTVRADPRQLEQVLLELAVNARDAMGERGTLTLGVDRVTIGPDERPELDAGCFGRLQVIDDGPGMSPEVRARALEPFFTTRDLSERAGLGLATCYGIVSQNDGSIRLRDGSDGGLVVEILLPCATC